MTNAQWRLFAAVPLPPETQAGLVRIAADLRSRLPQENTVRWTDPRDAHLTLKFIGNWPAGDAPRLGDAIAAAAAPHTPFELRLSRPGVFPERGAPRVLWVGVEGAAGQLAQLRNAVVDALADAGCKPEAQPFRPHLTIARVPGRLSREAGTKLRRATEALIISNGAAFAVDRVVLFRSDLTLRGTVYTPLSAAPLGGAPSSIDDER